MKLKLLLRIKAYFEETQITLENEYGNSRDLQQLLDKQLMPEAYYEVLKQIELLQNATPAKVTSKQIIDTIVDCQY